MCKVLSQSQSIFLHNNLSLNHLLKSHSHSFHCTVHCKHHIVWNLLFSFSLSLPLNPFFITASAWSCSLLIHSPYACFGLFLLVLLGFLFFLFFCLCTFPFTSSSSSSIHSTPTFDLGALTCLDLVPNSPIAVLTPVRSSSSLSSQTSSETANIGNLLILADGMVVENPEDFYRMQASAAQGGPGQQNKCTQIKTSFSFPIATELRK